MRPFAPQGVGGGVAPGEDFDYAYDESGRSWRRFSGQNRQDTMTSERDSETFSERRFLAGRSPSLPPRPQP